MRYSRQLVIRYILFISAIFWICQQSGAKSTAAAPITATATAVCNLDGVSDSLAATLATPQANHALYLPLVNGGAGTVTPPPPMARELQYQVGKTYHYAYEMSSYAVFGSIDADNGVSPSTPNVTLSYGTAEISITGTEPGGIFVETVFVDPVFCVENGDAADQSGYDATVIAELQTPMIFRQHKNGVIVGLQIAPGTSNVAINQMKSILNSLQATLTDDNSYPIVENGSQGSYVAQYTAALQTDGVQFTRTMNDDSFINFYSQGDAPAVKLDNTVQSFLDRETNVFSKITFQETTDIMDDPASVDAESIAGIGLWGQTNATGLMQLTAVTNTPATRTPINTSAYQHADMAIIFDELTDPSHGIDIDTIDLAAELNALEADPDNAALFQRLTWIITADQANESNRVLTTIADRLDANLSNDAIARVYVDLLGHDGSDYAQTQLATLIDPDNPLIGRVPGPIQEQAIVNLALVAKPLPTTVATIQRVQADRTGQVSTQATATTALGAMVPALRDCDPATAEAIYSDLQADLAAATEPQETYNLLLALGNTESADLLPVVQPFISDPDPQVQWAAIWALRDVPGLEVESLLIGLLDDDGLDPGYPLPAAAITLKNKPGKPSDNANDVLAGYYGDENPFPKGDVFHETWDWEVGNDNLGGSFPGELLWKSPPEADSLEATVNQSINYHLYLPKFDYALGDTLAMATAFTKPQVGNPDVQEFGYQYTILGKSFNATFSVPCTYNTDGTITKGTREIVNYQFVYSLWQVIDIGVSLDVTGSYRIDYEYGWDLCIANDMSAYVNLIPKANIHATANASVTALKVVKGGIELAVDIIDVRIPATLNAEFDPQVDFKVCATLPVIWEAVHVKLFIFLDRWSLLQWDWVNEYKDDIWDYPLAGDTFYIFDETCWTSSP